MSLVRPTDVSNVVPATVAAIDALEKLINVPPWIYVADYGGFQNSWSDGGSSILRVRFRKIGQVVYMENQAHRASAPAQDTVMFTLPTGYWPQNSIDFIVPDVGAGTPSITQIRVDARGVLYEFSNAGGGTRDTYCVISYMASYVSPP